MGRVREGNNINYQPDDNLITAPDPELFSEPVPYWDSLLRPLKDPGFRQRILWGSLWGAIPIYGLIAQLGYLVEYTSNVIHRADSGNLPPWKSFRDSNQLFASGIMTFLAFLIYSILITVISVIVMLPVIPQLQTLFAQIQNHPDSLETLTELLTSLICPLLVIISLWLILLQFFPLLLVLYAKERNFAALFSFGAAFRLILTDVWGFIVINIYVFLAVMVISIIASIFSIIGIIPVIGWIISWVVSSASLIASGILCQSTFGEFYYKNRLAFEKKTR
jgi:hypothetical protein